METNIFRTQYQQPENRLTYSFLTVLEHLSTETLAKVLHSLCENVPEFHTHSVSLLYGGGLANPDGSLHLKLGPSHEMVVYLESKTHRLRLDLGQIRRHIDAHLRDTHNLLLVVTASKSDKEELLSLGDDRLRFTTWHRVVELFENLAERLEPGVEQFLLEQFREYAETGGEAWRGRMIDPKMVESVSRYISLEGIFHKFNGEAWRLMETVKAGVSERVGANVTAARVYAGEGVIAVGCDLQPAPLELWLFYGIYYNTKARRIPFKEDSQPEYIIALGSNKKVRQAVSEVAIFQHTAELELLGFEFNVANRTGDNWTLCYWHDPMKEHQFGDPADLTGLFARLIEALFRSEFFRNLLALRPVV
jgi:hypothetical protein